MNLQGPDFLVAFTFALIGVGLGLVCGVGLTFWIAGVGSARRARDRESRP